MLVAGGYDPRALATIDWLASRHEVPVYAYTVAMVRFGGERLLTVRREPADPAEAGSEVEWLLSGGAAGRGGGAAAAVGRTRSTRRCLRSLERRAS